LVALAVGALLLSREAFDTTLQSVVYDKAIEIGNATVRNQVTIVALDDDTVRQYGHYPLPHQAYTDLLRALRPLSASVIAFDVAFYEPAMNPDEDRALAAAIHDAGNVLLAMQGSGLATIGDHIERYPTVQLPVPILQDAAAGVAAVNIHPDPDGRVRYTQLLIEGPDGTAYYSLPLVTAARKVRAELGRAVRAGFIGALSLSAVPDSYPVPNSGGEKMFGVEIWANAAQSILTNRYPVLKQSNVATLAQLVVVTLAGLLLVLRWRLYGFIGALA